MATLRIVLERYGEAVAGLWLTLAGIIILFAFPITGIAASFFVGGLACELVGRGSLGVIFFHCRLPLWTLLINLRMGTSCKENHS
jgi:hypothetical protein